MQQKVYIYDSTINDQQSKVRGIGRYIQILQENFQDEWTFTNNLASLHSKPYSLSPILINPFFNFLQKPLTMNRVAKKQIAVIHDLIPLKYPKHFPIGIKGNINVLLNKLSLKNYDLIVTVSNTTKKDIIKYLKIPEKKVKVIYNCLPKLFANPKPYTLNPIPFCLYVGDATWNKNLVNLAKAIKIANVNCVFVGKIFKEIKKLSNEVIKENRKNPNYSITQLPNYSNPWNKELNQFLQEVGDDKRFIFPGFVTDDELIKLYQQARINILVSRAEGFGFSIIESASQACPSIISDIPVLREISQDTGIFVNPENSLEIAKSIKKLYASSSIRAQLGAQSQAKATKYSPEKFKSDWLSVLNN